MTVLATIDMPEYWGVKMSGIAEEIKELWRQGKEFIAEEHTQITVRVHRVDDAERYFSLKT